MNLTAEEIAKYRLDKQHWRETKFYKTRPRVVQHTMERYFPGLLYRHLPTGYNVYILAYTETLDWYNVPVCDTCIVMISKKWNPEQAKAFGNLQFKDRQLEDVAFTDLDAVAYVGLTY